MVYTVTFNPAIDYVVYISGGLKLNDINRNESEQFQFGGKGINVSNMLRTLGLPTVALGFVAGFIGEGLERVLFVIVHTCTVRQTRTTQWIISFLFSRIFLIRSEILHKTTAANQVSVSSSASAALRAASSLPIISIVPISVTAAL